MLPIYNPMSYYENVHYLQRVNGFGGFYIGTGLTEVLEPEKKDVLEYAVGMDNTVTGLRSSLPFVFTFAI